MCTSSASFGVTSKPKEGATPVAPVAPVAPVTWSRTEPVVLGGGDRADDAVPEAGALQGAGAWCAGREESG